MDEGGGISAGGDGPADVPIDEVELYPLPGEAFDRRPSPASVLGPLQQAEDAVCGGGQRPAVNDVDELHAAGHLPGMPGPSAVNAMIMISRSAPPIVNSAIYV